MIIFDKSTPLNGAAPWASATTITVTDKPVWVSSFGLTDDADKVCARRILRSGGDTGFKMGNCGASGPDLGAIVAREPAERCDKPLCICKGQSGMALMEPGEYELVASGPSVEAKLITILATDWLLTCCPPEPCKTCA